MAVPELARAAGRTGERTRVATRVQKTKVGVFLALSIALVVVASLLIAGYRGGNLVTYEIVFTGSVLGLYKGGLVQYQGVEVGRVDQIWVGHGNSIHATMLIDASKITLHRGVKGVLEVYSLATGTMCVALSGGDWDAPPHDPARPIIAEESLFEAVGSHMATLMEQIGPVLENLGGVMEELNTAFDGMEDGQLAQTVTRINTTLEEIEGLVDEGRGLLSNTSEGVESLTVELKVSLTSLKTSVDKFGDWMDTAGEAAIGVKDTVNLIGEKLEPIDFNEKMSEVCRNLDEAVSAVETLTETVTYQSDNVHHSLLGTLETMNETLEAVRDLAIYLRENPSSVVRGKDRAKE
jgi:phospholipid/cholesterol/gamma-HCH transport system substrate-binding protein